jgi:tetratricopeptide (TPR) repeat protein
MDFNHSVHSEIYFEYFSLGKNAYRDKVRFYEQHQKDISALDLIEKIELDYDYLISVFEIGRYSRFLSKVDPLIERVIIDNVFDINGENVFTDLLARKAASLFNIGKYGESEKILRQLIKIDPGHSWCSPLLIKCLRKRNLPGEQVAKIVGIISLFGAVLLKISQILVLEHFYQELNSTLVPISTFLFALATISFVGLEIWYLVKYRSFFSTPPKLNKESS